MSINHVGRLMVVPLTHSMGCERGPPAGGVSDDS
jgi:hypothetical protein